MFKRLVFAGALALIAFVMPGTMALTSAAMPSVMSGIDGAVEQKPLLKKVHKHRSHRWRHRRHRRHHHRRPRFLFRFGYSRPYYRDYYDDRYYYRSSCGTYAEKKRCARKYRSFNWDTCRYTTYSGRKRLCPYVR